MRHTDFFKLTRAAQDNLLESLSGKYDPKPILWRPTTRPIPYLWLALSLACACGLIALSTGGYGDIHSALSLHPLWAVLGYMLLVAGIAAGVFHALAYQVKTRSLPFIPGIYLFPAVLIDARESGLRVYPLSELRGVAPSGRKITLSFPEGRVSLPVPAERVAKAVEIVREAADTMKQGPSEDQLRRMDPLQPSAVGSPLASTVPLATTPPLWIHLRWVVAAGIGVLVGGGIFALRNSMSDSAMFEKVERADTKEAYEAYLERGKSYRGKVKLELLPRTELQAAVAEGTVEAIDAFKEAYPSTNIQDEIDAARRAALVRAFEAAAAKGTLLGLLEFDETYAGHHLGEALAASRAAIYERALGAARAKLPAGAEAQSALLGRLVEHAKKVGPTRTDEGLSGARMFVRMKRNPSKDLDRADDLVKRNPMFTGAPSFPSKYLEDDDFTPHEREMTEQLASSLSTLFEPEVLVVVPADGADKAALEKAPTVVVTYRVEPSGAAYASKKPLGIFIGLLFYFNVELGLAGDEKPLDESYTFKRRIPVDLIRAQTAQPPRGELEGKVYQQQISDAFAEVRSRLYATWFAQPPAP